MEYGKEAYAIVTLLVIITFCTEKSESSPSRRSRSRSVVNNHETVKLKLPNDIRPFYMKAKSRLLQLGIITEDQFDDLKTKFH